MQLAKKMNIKASLFVYLPGAIFFHPHKTEGDQKERDNLEGCHVHNWNSAI